jgi:hypothetical protein
VRELLIKDIILIEYNTLKNKRDLNSNLNLTERCCLKAILGKIVKKKKENEINENIGHRRDRTKDTD